MEEWLAGFWKQIVAYAPIYVVVLLAMCVYHLERIHRLTKAIHFMMHHEFKKRHGIDD